MKSNQENDRDRGLGNQIAASIFAQHPAAKSWLPKNDIVFAPAESKEAKTLLGRLTPEMREFREGYTRNSRLPEPRPRGAKYQVMVQYFCDGVEQHKRVESKLDEIAERVGGITSWIDRSFPNDGVGGWTEFRQADNLRQARLFFSDAQRYAERCVIFERDPSGRRVRSYETEVYRQHFNKDESSVTAHKNQNI